MNNHNFLLLLLILLLFKLVIVKAVSGLNDIFMNMLYILEKKLLNIDIKKILVSLYYRLHMNIYLLCLFLWFLSFSFNLFLFNDFFYFTFKKLFLEYIYYIFYFIMFLIIFFITFFTIIRIYISWFKTILNKFYWTFF